MDSKQEYDTFLFILVFTSIILTVLSWTFVPELRDFYANAQGGIGVHTLLEGLLSPFLHVTFFHLFGNLLFLIFLWRTFTEHISARAIVPFFVLGEAVLLGVILFLNEPPTAGMSGFIFSIFGYMLVHYIVQKNPEYKGILLYTGISFLLASFQDPQTLIKTSLVGHVTGYIFGIVWYTLCFQYKKWKQVFF